MRDLNVSGGAGAYGINFYLKKKELPTFYTKYFGNMTNKTKYFYNIQRNSGELF